MKYINHHSLLLIGLIAIFAISILFILKKHNNLSAEIPSKEFIRSNHNDKIILVSGWNETELKKILFDFQNTYQKQGYPAYSISITKEHDQQYKLTFPHDIHPLLFIFLINYLSYPFNFDLTGRNISIAGSTMLNIDYQGLNQAFIGQKAIFYIPKNDSAYDRVYMITNKGGSLSLNLTTSDWQDTNQISLNSMADKLKTESFYSRPSL